MPMCRTEGIVLRTYDYSETSKIVSLYSKGFGKVKVIAKGARRPKSRFGASLELITEVSFIFYKRENRELYTIGQCDILCPFPRLKVHMTSLSYASAICELTDRLVVGEEPNPALYRAMREALQGIEEQPEEDPERFLWHFQLKSAGALGYRPHLDRCVSCGGAVNAPRVRFSYALGGPLCPACTRRDLSGSEVHLGTVRFLAWLDRYGATRAKVADALIGEVRRALWDFLKYHTGDQLQLKSLAFLDQIERGRGDAETR